MAYQKTIVLKSEYEIKAAKIQVGQWIKLGRTGAKCQYLGTMLNGAVILRYGKFSKAQAKRNKLQRQYAKQFGAK